MMQSLSSPWKGNQPSLQPIREADFNKIEVSQRVINYDYPHGFAALKLGDNLGDYGLSWRSELVSPIVELSRDGLDIWIGVDQSLVAIGLSKGQIYLSLKFNSSLLQILTADTFTAVLTEDQVWLFNPDFSTRLIKGLPDIATEIKIVESNLLKIQLLEGEGLTLNPETGTTQMTIE